jgi:hypothetical protein
MYGTVRKRYAKQKHRIPGVILTINVQRIQLDMKAIYLFCLRPEADSWVLPPQTPEVAPPLNNKKTWSDERNICFRQGCGSGSANFGSLDPDPHRSQNLEAVEAQNGAVEGRGRLQWRRGGSKWSHGGSEDHWSSQHSDEEQDLDHDPH